MAKGFFGKALTVALGVTVAAGAAATAGIVYGLKKWAKDEDSDEIKITTGGPNGIQITKTEDGKFLVNTKYDWASDPNFADIDDDIVINIETADAAECECCCEEAEEVVEECSCGCQEHTHTEE